MQCLLNSNVMFSILSDVNPHDYSNVIAANPAWKEDIELITECGPIAAFVSFDDEGERFSFCNTTTAYCPELHKPLQSPRDLKRLSVLGVIPHHPEIRAPCNCAHECRFPMDSWNIKETLEFEKVALLGIEGPLTVASSIRAECKTLVVEDSNLSDPSWNPFLSKVLNSPMLETLCVHADVKLNNDTKKEILKLLKKGNLHDVFLPTFDDPFSHFEGAVEMELDLEQHALGTLNSWMERTDPKLQCATFYCDLDDVNQLDRKLQLLGIGRAEAGTLVIDHPEVKGMRAIISIGFCAKDDHYGLTISIEKTTTRCK